MEAANRALRKISQPLLPDAQKVKNVQKALNRSHSTLKSVAYTALFVLCILLVVSNTLSSVARMLWNDVGNNWRYTYGWLLRRFSPWSIVVLGSSVVHLVAYWVPSAVFCYFDMFSSRLRKYEVQPTSKRPTWDDYRKAVRGAFFNQLFVAAPMMMLLAGVLDYRTDGTYGDLERWPSFVQWLVEIAGFLLVEELLFYTTHRAFHHRLLYKWVHKKHHEFTAPVAAAAVYCTPAEHALANILPAIAGPMLFKSHPGTVLSWFLLVTVNTVLTHSGYHLPLMPSPQAHDYHHLAFTNNFGALGILDWLFGTDRKFRASEQFKRHVVLFSFKSEEDAAEEQYEMLKKPQRAAQSSEQVSE